MLNFIKSRRAKYGAIILFIVLCLVPATYYLRVTTQPENKHMPEVVGVKKAQFTDVTISTGYIGRVDAINQVQIVPYISGYIAEIIVKGGQKVAKGETLAFLRQEEYAAALTAAQAELFSAKAELLNAKIKYERMQQAGTKAVSQQQRDDAKSAYLVAKGNLAKAEANELQAKINFNYTVLTAPFDGVIGNIDSSVGEFVSPQSAPLMQLIQYNPIRVVFSFSDKEFMRTSEMLLNKEALKIKLQLADGRQVTSKAKKIYTSNEIDDKTNSVAVYAEFDNADALLFPNAYVKVWLQKNYHNVLLVEKNLVDMKADGYYLYVVENNEVKLHKLSVLDEKDNSYVVANNFSSNTLLPTTIVPPNMLGLKVEAVFENKDA